MKIVGIVAEYNPFHKGHQLHVAKSKALSGADAVIAVMSGSFVQRGEPALVDKWTRTKMALLNGVDVVVELPVLYAVSSAEHFAQCAVKLLHDMGIVDIVSFGSETGDLEPLETAAKLLYNENDAFSKILKEQLGQGVGFAKARAEAVNSLDITQLETLASPNNILGIEYLKALYRLQSPVVPMTIKREGAGYHEESLSVALASASAIRKGIYADGLDSVLSKIPENTRNIFADVFRTGFAPICIDDYSAALNYAIRCITPQELKGILEVTEGLENRIKRCGNESFTATQLAQAIKSKRYTLTKIQRILIHILLNIKNIDLDYFNQNGYSPYIRVLGFRKERQELLKMISDNVAIPLLTNLKNAKNILDEKGHRMLEMETKATDVYFCFAPNASCRMANQDYTRPLIIIPHVLNH